MEEKIRKTGIDILGDVPWGTHFCQFYRTKEDLIETLVPYFRVGLENNEFCMWITSEPLGVDDAKRSLKRKVKNLDYYFEKGQIEILDYSQWYTKSGRFESDKVLQGWVEKEKQAIKKGFDGLRLTGNTFWLEEKDWKKFTDYEEEVNNVIGQYRMLAICTYSIDKCGIFEVIDVISNHQFALIRKEGNWEIIESSERKRAWEALQESEEKLSSFIDSAIEGFVLYDSELNLIEINKKALEIFPAETTKEGVIGRNILEISPGLEETGRYDRYCEVLKTGKPLYFDDIIPVPKFGDRQLSVSAFRVGEGLGLIFSDIAERKKAEEEKNKLLRAIEITKEAISIQSSDLLTIYTNDSMDKLFGYKKGELIGKHVSILDAFPTSKATIKEIKDSLEKEEYWEGEVHNRKKDGTEFITYATTSAIKDEDGKILLHISTQHDITERKKAEEALEESEKLFSDFFNQGNIGAVISSLKKGFIRTNQKFLDLLGYTEKELKKKTWAEMTHPEDLAADVKLHNKLLAGKINNYELDKRIFRKDGSTLYSHITVTCNRNSDGSPKHMLATLQDTTEKKKAEDALRKSQEDLRNLAAHLQSVREDERKSVAREIHDDVGQNLAALKMDMYMLEKKLPSEQKPLIDRMKTMMELTDSTVQTVRRIHEELRPTLLDGLGFVEAIKSYKKEFEDKTGVKCELHIEPERIDLSEEQFLAFFRILQESMTNVRLHAGATKVNVNIKEKNGKLELKVKDNGVGITEEQLTKSKSYGLIGIRERVNFLGGEVQIKGMPGKGTALTVIIPLKTESQD